ncbi:acetylglutamate kinase [Sediminibacillus albus]|uniref:Acetylglutamate kinase n=1 Tax=Sediminibacillus albus TaxID=407036 RepID=A0A1G8ZX47_9BACI|nr:acetylglutamate kinase [Sediminibacillus albus]SDK19633.1 acetylglutamate kinase [Sediminibacillus albus]
MNYLVIKCGGSVFEKLPFSFYQNITKIQRHGYFQPVIVHGGGPLISRLLEKTGVKSSFIDGLRVTTEEVLDVVEMALSGTMNKQIVANLYKAGGSGFGLSGIDGSLLTAVPAGDGSLGYVGNVAFVDDTVIDNLAAKEFIPVVSPIAMDSTGQKYNINADVAAASIAEALKAKLCFISDIPGILIDKDGEQAVLHQAASNEIEQLIIAGVIKGGMIPKVRSALRALENQVPEAAILNGLDPDSLMAFAKGEEIGTKIMLNTEAGYV